MSRLSRPAPTDIPVPVPAPGTARDRSRRSALLVLCAGILMIILDSLTAQGATTVSALTGGFRLAFGVGAGLMAVAFILAATVLRSRARKPQHEEFQAAAPAEVAPAEAARSTSISTSIASRTFKVPSIALYGLIPYALWTTCAVAR